MSYFSPGVIAFDITTTATTVAVEIGVPYRPRVRRGEPGFLRAIFLQRVGRRQSVAYGFRQKIGKHQARAYMFLQKVYVKGVTLFQFKQVVGIHGEAFVKMLQRVGSRMATDVKVRVRVFDSDIIDGLSNHKRLKRKMDQLRKLFRLRKKLDSEA